MKTLAIFAFLAVNFAYVLGGGGDVDLCPTFIRYDPPTNRLQPELYGFPAGFDYSDRTVYVGYGNNTCNSPPEQPCPGYLEVEPTQPGCFMSCYSGQQFDDMDTWYVKYNDDLHWIPTDITTMFTLPKVVRIEGNGYIWFFGRKLYDGAWRFGKVYAKGSPLIDGIYITDGAGGEVHFTTFEVLSC